MRLADELTRISTPHSTCCNDCKNGDARTNTLYLARRWMCITYKCVAWAILFVYVETAAEPLRLRLLKSKMKLEAVTTARASAYLHVHVKIAHTHVQTCINRWYHLRARVRNQGCAGAVVRFACKSMHKWLRMKTQSWLCRCTGTIGMQEHAQMLAHL